ncbi:MFS transporter [Rhodobacter sp. 24-YEA-8]|uniref:MFS transporter n=1 Tax=Rhodobacter sp. 24-YEA-8 TaxID=1884310 RepID=UPI00089D2DE4|nr:MFS transporter [Rhodobacter sp. 24-YEA-8]SED16583.1 Sugar phosphate permease [Rhodobacter sp. 24-YEA-8]
MTPNTSTKPGRAPAWGRRHSVFLIIFFVNFTIWLDEAVLAALTPYWAEALHLTPVQIGTGSAAYLLGYFPTLLVAGVLSDRFGARSLLLLSVLGCSILSAAMLWVHDYPTLFLRNVVFGVFFGFLWAPCNRIMALWLPVQERTRFGAIWFSSTMLAFAVAAPLALWIARTWVWEDAFLLVTVLGVPAFLLLYFGTRDRPEEEPRVTKEELSVIYAGVDPDAAKSQFSWAALGNLLRSRSVVAMVIATLLATAPTWFLGAWGFYQLINVYKLEGDTASFFISLGYCTTAAYGFFHGWVFQHIFGGRCRPTLAAGPVIAGIGFLIAATTSNPIVFALAVFGVANLANPFFWGTINAYWTQIAKPEYAGTLNGISAAGQVAAGYVLLSLSGGWVRPLDVAGIRALDTIWLVGAIMFFLTLVPVFIARGVQVEFRSAGRD